MIDEGVEEPQAVLDLDHIAGTDEFVVAPMVTLKVEVPLGTDIRVGQGAEFGTGHLLRRDAEVLLVDRDLGGRLMGVFRSGVVRHRAPPVPRGPWTGRRKKGSTSL